MTLIMLWKEPHVERLWLVSDSRLTSRGPGDGQTRLTDHAAKIMEAEVVLRRRAAGNPLGERDLMAILGFAYAGSSLVAMQTYTAVLPLWSRLETAGDRTLPSMGQFADHLGVFLDRYSKEVGPNGGCTCVLAGYGEASQSTEAWKIEAKGGSTIVRQLSLSEPGSIEVIGSASPLARDYLDRMRAAAADPQWSSQPRMLIRHILRADERPDIGGGVQLGMVTRDGFELGFDVQHFSAGMPDGSPVVAMTFRGFDFGEIGKVGEAFVNLRGFG